MAEVETNGDGDEETEENGMSEDGVWRREGKKERERDARL